MGFVVAGVGNVGCACHRGETDFEVGVLVDEVQVAEDVVEFAIAPVVPGVGDEDGFVSFGVRTGVGDVVDDFLRSADGESADEGGDCRIDGGDG